MSTLTVNAGSSTLKASLFEDQERLWTETYSWEGEAFDQMVEDLKPYFPEGITHVGHRVVHGGVAFTKPTVINDRVIDELKQLIPLAPLHNPYNIEGIEKCIERFPQALQYAVFDTAFHSSMPDYAFRYPIPYDDVRVYGFHGISHQYCALKANELHPCKKLITCHLGNGASLAAVRSGGSIDTTMGFTPLDGLMMGTRSGSIDPGLVTELMKQHHLSPEEMDTILNKQSGLVGVCGHNDMRDVLRLKKEGDLKAKLAFEMYTYRLVKSIGAMAAVLGGIDGIAFTAGVGENAAEVRESVCKRLDFLGIQIDEKKNNESLPDSLISRPGSTLVFLVHAREDLMIAKVAPS